MPGQTSVSRSTATGRMAPGAPELGDRLVRLAQDAERAGFRVAAEHLAYLAAQMFKNADTLRSA